MKKIPCLFQRDFTNPRHAILLKTVTPGLEWVLEGQGVATRKWDGTACLVREGVLYKRYDAKRGKAPPANGIPCTDAPDEVTGHWPHWIPVGEEPESKWHRLAWDRWMKERSTSPQRLEISINGTFELCGPHFNANPEGLVEDVFIEHGKLIITRVGFRDPPLHTWEGIHTYLTENVIEGIVYWKDGEPQCKIRRHDYDLPWPAKPAGWSPSAAGML